MNALYFAAPQWIHLLWAVAAFVALLAWLERRGRGDLGRFVAAVLQRRLVQRTTPLRRALRLVFLGLTGLFLTLALMRPQWGGQFVSTPRVGAQIMVCLDVSRSMLAEDVAPNRLERAKAELRDLLGYLEGDQVGLIAFAGRATVLSPLTPDFSFLRLVLDDAGPHSVTRGGTRLEEPIRKALAGFRDTSGPGGESEVSRSILLITDGEDHDSFPRQAAEAAAERGVRIIAIGFGDEAGSEIEITDPATGARTLLRDADGNPVRSRLDGELLREMALVTGGAYIPAGTGAVDLDSIYRGHLASLTRGRLDGGGYLVRNDAFQWALLFALVCLVAAVATPGVAARTAAGTTRASQPSSQPAPKALALIAGLAVVGLCGTLAPPAAKAQAEAPPAQAAPAPAEADAAERGASPAATAGEPDLLQGSAPEDRPEEDGTRSEPEDPRAAYNRAVAHLDAGRLEDAARGFEATRADAGTDGEVRFRATYNLGWVEVGRADTALEQDPQAALAALQRAADWFREAIALRPDHAASRHNLELVLHRALVLADQLAERDGEDIAGRLDRLIEAQRGFLANLGQGVDLAALADDPAAVEESRRVLRAFATDQLELLTQAERLSEAAGVERDALQAKPEQERTAEEAVRLSQLGQLLQHLHRARERMGQSRGQLRRLEAERAYRRVAEALTSLKRARDQLQGPVARLDALLADGMDLLRRTGQKLAAEAAAGLPSHSPGQGPGPEAHQAPAWLTADYLSEAQAALEERTGELHQGLAAGLAATSEPSGQPGAEEALGEQQFRRRLEAAAPLIGEARQAFRDARDDLEAERTGEALVAERLGLSRLAAAREHFLDLARLVELLYQDEMRIADVLAPAPPTPATDAPQADLPANLPAEPEASAPTGAPTEPPAQSPAEPPDGAPAVDTADSPSAAASPVSPGGATALQAEYLPLALELQDGNRERLQRVSSAIIDRLMAALDAADQLEQAESAQPGQPGPQGQPGGPHPSAPGSSPAPSPTPPAPGTPDAGDRGLGTPDPQAVEAERRLMEEADALRIETEKAMQQALADLHEAAALPVDDPVLPAAIERSRQSVDHTLTRIADLRRLFFSVIDHLRETLRQQIDLGDRTEETAVLAGTEPPADLARRLGPLGADQEALAERAGGIADALAQQAEQTGPAAQDPGPEDADAATRQQEAQTRLRRAADLVTSGRDHMDRAADAIGAEPPPFETIRDQQRLAVEALAAALAALEPPPPPEPESNQDQQDQQDQEQQDQDQQGGEDSPQEAQAEQARQQPADPGQLLQGVRDREAQRREERAKHERRGYEPVEKDW